MEPDGGHHYSHHHHHQHHNQSGVTNAFNNRGRFSYNAQNTVGAGDFVQQHRSWPAHQQAQYQQQRQHTAPFTGSASSLRQQDVGTVGTTASIPIVNGVSSGHWRQQRTIASSNNTTHPVSHAPVLLNLIHYNTHRRCNATVQLSRVGGVHWALQTETIAS